MKRKMFVTLVCVLAAVSLNVLAAPPLLVDDAQLMTYEEQLELTELLEEISTRQGVDVVVVTTYSLGGKSPVEYADDFFDYNGYGEDGVLLLVSMEDREWWVSTTGFGITAITNVGLSYISDEFVPYLSDGEYAQGFRVFAELCDKFITQARNGDAYDYHNLPKVPFDPGEHLMIALVVGLLAAVIATLIMRGQLKSVRQQPKADDYVKPGSMHLTQSRDLYLYSNTSRREKPKNNGGSSTHRSSSGRSHGGGGGRF